jgi:AraC-like DNA-binding protein
MRHAPAEVPAAFIRSMLLTYQRYGQNPAEALARAEIDPSVLSEPQARVTAEQMEVFTDHAMRELDDEALGWFSRRFPYGTAGMLCFASLSSANLQVALVRWCRNYGFLQDNIRLEFKQENGIAWLEVHELSPLCAQREFCLVSTLRNILGYASWLVDSKLPLLATTFPFSAPLHATAYALMFRCEARFEQRYTSFSFDARYLSLPVRRTDADLRQMLLRPMPLIVLQYRRDRLLSRRVRDLLRSNPKVGNADEIAHELHVSTRSLYRHLSEENTSLQRVKDEVRHEIAIEQLVRTTKTLKQIASAAGFSNEASFCRAFTNWTGTSPGVYRDRVHKH